MGATRSDLLESSPLHGGNAEYVEALYEQYLTDPASVDARWREYFSKLPRGTSGAEAFHRSIQSGIAQRAKFARDFGAPVAAGGGDDLADEGGKQGAVARLVQIYANRGHLIANLDPLSLTRRERPKVLDLAYFGLSDADLGSVFHTGSRTAGIPKRATLREILQTLNQVYCGTVGAEFAHVSNTDERLWLQDEFQVGRVTHKFSAEERRNILWQLTAAEGLERYLHTKYVGQKRFSLEGGESLIPLLDDLVQTGGSLGAEEFVIGMAHRGRLNVLVNVLGKSPKDLFSEFEGKYDLSQIKGSGDVKYHKGFSADLRTAGGNVHVGLAFNPSHLEVVNPVVEGSVRARQERRNDSVGERVVPLLIHGDSAFGGQGVVMETLQLSQARGYYTGGTIHLVVNNQVGFTTSKPEDMR
jgi:2-oxoglutarate dehydrogenase E1 component